MSILSFLAPNDLPTFETNLIFQKLKSTGRRYFVQLENGHKIWTASFNENSENIPIVLIHGYVGSIGIWAANFDQLSQNRPVHAFDLLGFGQSSRPDFPINANDVEEFFVSSISEWAHLLNLKKFHLVGHSFGGYLATLFYFKNPKMVAELILADPWGFDPKPDDHQIKPKPTLMSKLKYYYFNPMSFLRISGPLGHRLLKNSRPNLMQRFEDAGYPEMEKYIILCNSCGKPSGETAFHRLTTLYSYALNPLCDRVGELFPDFRATFIYGGKTGISRKSVDFMEKSGNFDIRIFNLDDSDHHVYLDVDFNRVVINICCGYEE